MNLSNSLSLLVYSFSLLLTLYLSCALIWLAIIYSMQALARISYHFLSWCASVHPSLTTRYRSKPR